ncbi:hypothetical protein Acr_17g0005060 [Actinidia rufa]|uniref:Retrotransposon gag domain-containing protein n=1 Tax=Actinidia rufa TaxID=165716 RepID=A0A7J0G2B1_9ERIC|nr:hypothetical protein Acr_17g0005060 [Actinidia rufa]
MPPRLRERDGGRVRGRAPGRARGRARSLEALREFVRAIRDEIQQPPPPPPVAVEPLVHRAPAEPRAQSAMREFRRQDPPRFSGEPDPIEAELWLKKINLAFEMIELDEDILRIRAATYQFSGRALTWWDVVKTTHNVAMMTWVDFERVFLDYYFPQVVRNAKRREFLALKQGDLSLVQYAAQFNDLARFAPECVATDYLRARCFEQGLRPGLRGKVVSFELNTFEEVMKKALVIDGEAQEAKMDRDSRTSGKGSHSGQQPKRQRQGPFAATATVLLFSATTVSAAESCHFSTTTIISGVESQCSSRGQQQQQASGGQPRLYAVTDIAPEPSVIRGTFPVFNSWATVLIDTGASCSFIASAFAFALGLEVDLLDSTLLVDTPVGGVVPLNRVCRGCVLVIADRRIEADLVVMDMSGFDIILGMDWLSSNRAIVDCFRRRVTITISSGDSFYFMGDRLDFPTSSLHHLRGRQCTIGYLASLWAEEGEATLDELPPIVCEKPRSTAASLAIHEWKMLEQLGEFDLEVGRSAAHATLFTLVARPTLLSRVLEAQQSDEEAVSFRARVTSDEAMDGWTFSPDSGLREEKTQRSSDDKRRFRPLSGDIRPSVKTRKLFTSSRSSISTDRNSDRAPFGSPFFPKIHYSSRGSLILY